MDEQDTGVEEERDKRLRAAVFTAVENAQDEFCQTLENYKDRHGFTDEEITRALAQWGPNDDPLDWWNEWVEDS